ncbi:UNVERIFIED_CONTAM: hypothetical protein Scaly_3120800 [Sesamum calycinum]|uniref:Reverse transcriptase domain-containing protein n=1 Tax=Sesamum calycinum TaxID=2727403 RepID=A0AAW2JJ69_9LAMI
MPGSLRWGRSITDNIFLAQEMVRQYTRKRISPRCTINVDLRKAFDSVSWTFLSQVLHGSFGTFPALLLTRQNPAFLRQELRTTYSATFLARTEFTRGEMPVRYLAFPLRHRGCREWSVFGYKSSHSQRQSLRKSTGFVGIFSGTPNEHRLLGRISVIPKMKGVLASGIHKLGTWPSCPSFMEHPPQGRHALGTVGRRCLSQRRISLGLATEEGRLTTPSTACRNPQQNHYRLWLARGGPEQ